MSNIKISIDEADNSQLFYFATNILGIDVKAGANSSTLRAKIEQAAPGTIEITAPAASAPTQAASPTPAIRKVSGIPDGVAGLHYKYDPKVMVRIAKTNEATRSREVQLSVNGDVVILKRGETVPIPYRHFIALQNAIETVGQETDEINPVTNLPIVEFIEQPSYPFQVLDEPSDEEIAAWHARVDGYEIGEAA